MSPSRPRWKHRTAASEASDEARIRPASWKEAQEWCNFVLFEPTDLPAGLKVETGMLRPEAPPGRPPGMSAEGRFPHNFSNRASYRCLAAGHGRALEIKQFFYDLGPPAWDHPAFWLSETEAFDAGPAIGWNGIDFRQRPGASVTIDRTTIEVAVLQGEFSVEELRTLCRGFQPVAPEARAAILSTPLGEAAYQRRHPDLVVTVPMGYWTHRRRPASLITTVITAGDPAGPPAVPFTIPGEHNFELDTVFSFGDPERPQEVELVFVHVQERGRTIRVLTTNVDAPNALVFPPVVDRQPCTTRRIEIGGTEVYHAYRDARYGQHEGVWKKGNAVFMLLAKPARETSVQWFERLLEQTV